MGKGIVYYYSFKKYKQALDQYLKAYEYSKKTKDQYQQNKLQYHIGVVKSYIGFYDDALDNLYPSKNYFYNESLKKDIHPNILFGIKRGYFNSLHQILVCYRNLRDYKRIDSLLALAVNDQNLKDNYTLEYGYFLKEKGINEFHKADFRSSITSLNQSLIPIKKAKDFAWESVCYAYLGKSYLRLNNEKKAIEYFTKVDSIFQKEEFMIPEVRDSYECLIQYYKTRGEAKSQLYYTGQLVKADNILNRKFPYLSSKIFREYDTSKLNETHHQEKKTLQREKVIFIGGTIFLLVIFLHRYWKEQNLQKNYRLLEERILNKNVKSNKTQDRQDNPYSLEIEKEILDDLLKKLEDFEKKNKFLESGITLYKLASKFQTNSTYLSQVINEYKGSNFKKYIGELRIEYITQKLYNDKKYLSYTIEGLAEECGIASRPNFSNLFQEYNGIRPRDFIKKRMEDLKNKENLEEGAISCE
ncbi:helix-turn-helix domain-containing protein [Chryseobacterium defluvii]|nr:AraC family transcriptional regulator [Chryseobacterium defluvii]